MDGDSITLDEVVYRTRGGERIVRVYDAAYLGIIERQSDGYTCLSILKPHAQRIFNVEVGALLSVRIGPASWHPQAPPQRWRLRAVELRNFIECDGLPNWALPYFDPNHPKHVGQHQQHIRAASLFALGPPEQSAKTQIHKPDISNSLSAAMMPWDRVPGLTVPPTRPQRFPDPVGFTEKLRRWNEAEAARVQLTAEPGPADTPDIDAVLSEAVELPGSVAAEAAADAPEAHTPSHALEPVESQRRGFFARFWLRLFGRA